MSYLQKYDPKQRALVTQDQFNVVFDSVVEAAVGPVLRVVKMGTEFALRFIPQSILEDVAIKAANNAFKRSPDIAERWLHDLQYGEFAKGSENNNEIIRELGFDPIPSRVYDVVQTCSAQLALRLQSSADR